MSLAAFAYSDGNGATFAELQSRVLRGSFSESLYLEETKANLNDAVLEVCKRARLFPQRVVCPYGSSGLVTLPGDDGTGAGENTFWLIEGVWLAASTATTGTADETQIAGWTQRRLAPLDRDPAELGVGNSPVYYTLKRWQGDESETGAVLGRTIPIRLRVSPAAVGASGKVIVLGRQRPPLMQGSTDLTGLGADADRALIAYCRARLFELEEDDKMAVFWDDRFEQAIRSLAQGGVVLDGPMVTPGVEDEGTTAEYGV